MLLDSFGDNLGACNALSATRSKGSDSVARLLTALQQIEPRLRDLYISTEWGTQVCGAIDGIELPLELMGNGLRRVFAYVAAVLQARAGALLIDEIENGLHYSHYAGVWKALCSTAHLEGVQLFAVTHSAEFLRAALTSTSNESPSLAVCWRLDRVDGKVQVTRISTGEALAADEFGVDIR